MTTLAEIWVAVRPDTAKTGPELNTKLSKVDTSKAGKKAGDDYSKGFGTGIKSVVGLAAGALAALKVKDFLKESTDGYRAHLKVAAVTTQVIKTTGKAAKVSATQVASLADAIELKTGVDGDAIQSGANLLLTFTNVRNEVGKGNDIFNQSTSLLADMSVALGQDAKGSAIQLGKALNDPVKGVTALSKVGVSFTEQQKKQIRTLVASGNVLGAQKIILRELSKEFGGAAAAAADPADRATVAYHQLQDQIGSGTLPVVNALASGFADFLAPALIDIATKHGPAVTAFLSGLAPKISASLGLLITGDFNGKVRKALGGLEEDSPYVGGILDIRDGLLSVKNILTILAAGNFSGRVFGQEEDSKFVDYLFRAHEGLEGVYETFRLLATGDFRTRIFGLEEDSPFIDFLFRAREELGKLGESVKSADTAQLKTQFSSAVDSLGKLLPLVSEFRGMLPSVTDVIGTTVDVLGFLADHTETIRKLLPLIAAGFIAYKVAQAAANAAALLSVPIKISEIAVNRSLVKSNRELVASRAADTVAIGAETVATGANSAAKSTGILTTIRLRAAAIAHAVSTRAIAVATAVWTGAQWLLNAALTANPIGLVIAAVALLALGIVLLWKKSETFRTIITGVFNAFKSITLTVITFVWQTISGFFANLLDGAAKAFGWVPGLGPKLKAAATWFGEFRDSVNTKLDGLKDQSIGVEIKYSANGVNLTAPSSVGRRAFGGPGGPVDGPGTTTSDTAGLYALSRKEWVIKAKSSMKYGDYAMASVNAGTAKIIPNGRMATGGRPGLTIDPTAPRSQILANEIASHAVKAAGPFIAQGAKQLAADGGPPGAVRSFRGKKLNDRTIRMLLRAESILGRIFHITQGSYSTSVAASGSTHAGGGAMDTDGPGGWNTAVSALRRVGFAAWHRTPSQGPWNHHIHSIALGDSSASAAAKNQMAAYRRGGDGLGHGMAGGGLVGDFLKKRVKSYDGGGPWPTGTFGYNGSGKTETVRTAEQERSLRGNVGQLTITNWRDGTGFFRLIARDEIGAEGEFLDSVGRMR